MGQKSLPAKINLQFFYYIYIYIYIFQHLKEIIFKIQNEKIVFEFNLD